MKTTTKIATILLTAALGIGSQFSTVNAKEAKSEYEAVTSMNQLISLVEDKYDSQYCLYALRAPLTAEKESGEDNILVVKVIYNQYDGQLREESVAAQYYYNDIIPDYSNITGSPSNDYFWVADKGHFSTESILDVVQEEVGPLEEMNYLEPVVLKNTYQEDLLSDRYSLALDQVEMDKQSKVFVQSDMDMGEIKTFDEFTENLGHSLVYWNDKNKHDGEDKHISEKEDIPYRIYLEKVKISNTKVKAKNEMVAYVAWDCPTLKETFYMQFFAPQSYIVPAHDNLKKVTFAESSCSYLQSFGYNGAEHGDVDKMVWWSCFWDTTNMLPMLTEMYDGNLDELAYYEPVQIYEGMVKAGTYHDEGLHPEEWEK